MSFGGNTFGTGTGFGQTNTGGSLFGGFGQNNNNNNNNTTSAFGANNTGGFGQSNNAASTSNMFGSNTGGGFGAGAGGFGTNNNTTSAFGARPAFGAPATTTTTSLFGTPTATSGTGAFGTGGFGSTNTTSSSTGFGAATPSLFGNNAAKPATGFGTAANATTTTPSLFGNTAGGSGFGMNNPGIGTNIGPAPGTQNPPFTAFVEKEANSTGSNSFQNILFQAGYKDYSSEELRMADYAQGHKFGNAANGFGATSGFGGFGNTNAANTNQATSGFGTNNTTTTGGGLFGNTAAAPATSGFGAAAANNNATGSAFSGGLFNSAKPATTGGLFGTTTTQTAAPTNSLFGNTGGFGTTNNTTTTNAFGTANNSNTASGGIFGNKSPFGAATTGTTNAFGTANNTTSAFGQSANTLGNTTQNTTSSLFGNTAAQPAAPSVFGNLGSQNTTSAFGQAAAPARSLFGSTPAVGQTSSLFGNTANNTTPSAFGTPAQPAASSLFAPRPATGGSLFGTPNNTQQTQSAFGLSGSINNQQQQPAAQGSLFGSLGQNTQQPTSLFGAPAQNAGSSIFGTPNNNNQQQQQQQSQLGQSIFALPNGLTTSIDDPNAFGASGLFANLGGAEVKNPGPLVTPLSGSRARKQPALPLWKLHPGSVSRYSTPPKRGYGFTYSTYGSPSTPGSTASTPGTLGGSLLGGGSISRALGKSMSISNLRKSFNAEDSILAPGSFSASAGTRYNNGASSLKKLNIDRNLKIDLFSPPKPKDRVETSPTRRPSKRVSFENKQGNDHGGNATTDDGASTNDRGRSSNGALSSSSTPKSNSANKAPEMEQVSGKELAIVPEEGSSPAPSHDDSSTDFGLGSYWMSPSKEEIKKMNRVQRSQVSNFTVGREKAGQVQFKVPVDLTAIDLDDLFGGTVDLRVRSATVYPNPAKKPPMGKGLNVPAEITLEQSFPRSRAGRSGTPQSRRLQDKHVQRLRSIPNTGFVDYDGDKGIWKFTVEHFTTYGFDYDDDDDEEMTTGVEDSEVQTRDDEATPRAVNDSPDVDPDDTFDFRKKKRALPGAFDYTGQLSEDEDDGEMADATQQSFLSERSAGSQSKALTTNDVDMDDEYAMQDGPAASAGVEQHHAAEPQRNSQSHGRAVSVYTQSSGGIMRARLQALIEACQSSPLQVLESNDWMDMLQKTVSPMKRNRAALRAVDQDEAYENFKTSMGPSAPAPVPRNRGTSDQRGFANSMDLMKSLFDSAPPPPPVKSILQTSIPTSGFKNPYKRKAHAVQDDEQSLSVEDRAYHDTVRPSWGPDGTLVVATTPKVLGKSMHKTVEKEGLMSLTKLNVVSKKRDIRFAKFSNESTAKTLGSQMSMTNVRLVKGVPSVVIDGHPSLKSFFDEQKTPNPASVHEKSVWELASVLFDDLKAGLMTKAGEDKRQRRANVSRFWQRLVADASQRAVSLARSPEDKAVAALGAHNVADACKHLLDGKDFRLATLVSLIGTDDKNKKDMREQVKEWRDTHAFSEFSEPIRAIYELLGGNVCAVAGEKGGLENRMESFIISQRFGMDWKQAFGLRLWYAISSKDDIAEAINLFEQDVNQDKEGRPQPWFIEQGIAPLWEDASKNSREDLLWGLLKLFAREDVTVDDVLRPENSQLSPLDYRLSWQLGRALLTTGKVSFGDDANNKLDAATLSFASQLTNEGDWLEAVFVLLHLTDASARAKAIREHLARHAGRIGPELSQSFATLTQTYKLPAAWVWQAKALYARSMNGNIKEQVYCLLRAKAFAEAHKSLVEQVAPLAIIERDEDGLADVLKQFMGHEKSVADWNVGGEVYRQYLQLLEQLNKSSGGKSAPAELVQFLMKALPALKESASEDNLVQVAAVADMANVVAKTVVEMSRKGEMPLSNVLNLPLPEDGYLKFSNELAFAYYREVMVGRA